MAQFRDRFRSRPSGERRREQPGAERGGVDAGQAQRRGVEHDPADAPPLGRDRAGHEALLGDDDVGTELVEDGVDLPYPQRDRGDEDVHDRPLQGAQARLLAVGLLVEHGVVDVGLGAHREDLRADPADEVLVAGAAVPGDLVTVGDEFRRDRQAGTQVAGQRHGGEQDAGHRGAPPGPCPRGWGRWTHRAPTWLTGTGRRATLSAPRRDRRWTVTERAGQAGGREGVGVQYGLLGPVEVRSAASAPPAELGSPLQRVLLGAAAHRAGPVGVPRPDRRRAVGRGAAGRPRGLGAHLRVAVAARARARPRRPVSRRAPYCGRPPATGWRSRPTTSTPSGSARSPRSRTSGCPATPPPRWPRPSRHSRCGGARSPSRTPVTASSPSMRGPGSTPSG